MTFRNRDVFSVTVKFMRSVYRPTTISRRVIVHSSMVFKYLQKPKPRSTAWVGHEAAYTTQSQT